MQAKDDYQNSAKVYDFLFAKVLTNIHEAIRTYLNHCKAKNVIDLCCGTGMQLRYVSNENMTLTGVDISQAMLYQARKKSPSSIHYLEKDASNTGLPTSSYDAAIITFALHEKPASKHLAIFQEACRLLTQDGVLLLADYCTPPEDIVSLVMSKLCFQIVERLAGIDHYHCYQDWMRHDAIEGFLESYNPGKVNLMSAHYFGCVKLYALSNIPPKKIVGEKR